MPLARDGADRLTTHPCSEDPVVKGAENRRSEHLDIALCQATLFLGTTQPRCKQMKCLDRLRIASAWQEGPLRCDARGLQHGERRLHLLEVSRHHAAVLHELFPDRAVIGAGFECVNPGDFFGRPEGRDHQRFFRAEPVEERGVGETEIMSNIGC